MRHSRHILAALALITLWLAPGDAQMADAAGEGDGLIVRIHSPGLVFIDRGQNAGITRGDIFDIISSEVLVHPLSDSILAVTPKSVGAIQVLQVYPSLSLVKIVHLDRGVDPMLKPVVRVSDPKRLEQIEKLIMRGVRVDAGVDVPRRLAVIPGLFQIRIGERNKGWSLLAAEAVSLIGGIAYRSNSNDWYDQYRALPAGLPESDYDFYFNKGQDRRTLSNRLFWVAGALWVYNWVDVMYLGEGANLAYRPADPPSYHVGMGLSADGRPLLRLGRRF